MKKKKKGRANEPMEIKRQNANEPAHRTTVHAFGSSTNSRRRCRDPHTAACNKKSSNVV